jgi:hypothetical protein
VAILAVDEVWLREPRLLVPGMQPLGPVKIDLNNPLTRELNGLFMPRMGHNFIDIVNNTFPSLKSGSVVITENGLAVSCAGSAVTQFTRIDKYNLVSAMTIAVAVSITSLANYSALMSCWNTNITSGWEFRGGDGATDGNMCCIRLGATAGEGYLNTIIASSAALAAGDRHKIVAVSYVDATVDGPAYMYVNGKQIETKDGYGTGTGNQGSPSTGSLRIGQRADYATDLNGQIHAAWLWGRALTNSEHLSLATDPYQFLIPA